jgi:NhaP-type Na+/H+ or K+/H+ antiporter
MMESTLNGVIAIIVTITLIDMAKINSFAPSMIAAKIIYTFLISVAVGSAAAVFWTTVLNKIRKLQNSIFLTIAFVMVVYSVCESLGSDGSIGAFVFGIVAGNIRIIKKLGWLNFLERYTISVKGKSFNDVEKSFFSEVVFVLSTFFFVYIGISIRITNFYSMLYGLLFTLIIFLARIPAVNYSLDKNVSKLDCMVAAAMTPKGLVTAVLASLVAQSGIAGGALLQDIIYSVIMFSIIFATLLAFLAEKGYAANIADTFFKRHTKESEDSLPQPQITSKNI